MSSKKLPNSAVNLPSGAPAGIDKEGNTALHRAAAAGAKKEVIKDLMSTCGINQLNNNKETPLFLAVEHGHAETATYLVSRGADLKLTYGAKKTTILIHALQKKSEIKLIGALTPTLTFGNIDQTLPNNGMPILHLAAEAGHVLAIEHFIKNKKANINKKDEHGHTALHYTAHNNHKDAVEKLLENGADLAGLNLPVNGSTEIKTLIGNHIQFLARQKEIRQAQEDNLITVIAEKLFVKVENDAGIQKVKQALQTAIRSKLPEVNDENNELLGRFIKYSLLKNSVLAKHAVKTWNTQLTKNNTEYLQFIKDLEQALTQYKSLTNHDIAIENISNAIAINTKLNIIVPRNTLYKSVKDVLAADVRLKKLDLDEEDFIITIAEELAFSTSTIEDGLIKKPNDKPIIYQLRIKYAIDLYLHQQELLNPDEILAYEIAERLTTKIKDLKDLKEKKFGIVCYLIAQLLLSYPSHNSILAILKMDPNKNYNFVEVIFVKLEKFNMDHFSTTTVVQNAFSEMLKTAMNGWLTSNNVPNATVPAEAAASNLNTARPANQKDIKFTPNQQSFIGIFCAELDDLYCKFRALDLKSVTRVKEAVDNGRDVVAANQANIPNINTPIGIQIPTGAIAKAVMDLCVYLKDVSIADAANRMSRLFGGYSPKRRSQIVELVADSVAYRYQYQIEQLTPLSVIEFARCAAYRAVEYLTRCDENLVAAQPGIFSRLGANFSDYVRGRKQAPKLLSKLEQPVKVLMNGVVEGESKKDNEPLGTHDNNRWSTAHIFNNTGIILRDEAQQLRLYTDERLDIHEAGTPLAGTPLYGFRYGTKAEVEHANYKPLPNNLVSVVLQSIAPAAATTQANPPTPAPSAASVPVPAPVRDIFSKEFTDSHYFTISYMADRNYKLYVPWTEAGWVELMYHEDNPEKPVQLPWSAQFLLEPSRDEQGVFFKVTSQQYPDNRLYVCKDPIGGLVSRAHAEDNYADQDKIIFTPKDMKDEKGKIVRCYLMGARKFPDSKLSVNWHGKVRSYVYDDSKDEPVKSLGKEGFFILQPHTKSVPVNVSASGGLADASNRAAVPQGSALANSPSPH